MAIVSATLPARYSLRMTVAGNSIVQLDEPEYRGDIALSTDTSEPRDLVGITTEGRRVKITTRPSARNLTEFGEVLLAEGVLTENAWPTGATRWIKPVTARSGSDGIADKNKRALASWVDALSLREESATGETPYRSGLRPPQLGAMFSVVGHWKAADALATCVMPTGTGKTEVMLALLVFARLGKLLVVVPTNVSAEVVLRRRMTILKEQHEFLRILCHARGRGAIAS